MSLLIEVLMTAAASQKHYRGPICIPLCQVLVLCVLCLQSSSNCPILLGFLLALFHVQKPAKWSKRTRKILPLHPYKIKINIHCWPYIYFAQIWYPWPRPSHPLPGASAGNWKRRVGVGLREWQCSKLWHEIFVISGWLLLKYKLA